jgi:FdhE protein
MTQDVWLATHPYLRSIAEFEELVKRAADSVPMARARMPNWDDYSRDFDAGVPLLESSSYPFDVEPAGRMVLLLIKNLAFLPLPRNLADKVRELGQELCQASEGPRSAMGWIESDRAPASAHSGLLRYFGCVMLARYIRPVVEGFRTWRREERWLRSYCPACGSPPAMAQLIGVDPGRLRYLWCGGCGTRWRYRRTGCPFCQIADDHKLAALAIEGEGGLRIDYCESCGGYLKTYDGVGNESLLLADWSSLHLDVLACSRGLRRLAASLYDL